MSEKQLNELLDEIKTDESGNGFIDCGTGTDYTDNNQYQRIVAAIKQNIELQQQKEELEEELEVARRREEDLLNDIKIIKVKNKRGAEEIEAFMNELCIFLDDFKKIKYPLRIADYLFEKLSEHVVYSYDPLQAPEPKKIELEVIENNLDEGVCPICKNALGKYPAISRKDNKTKICSNCGMEEALRIFYENHKEGNVG